MVQSGMELDVAVQFLHESAKNNKAQPENGETLPAAQAQPRAEEGVNVQIDNLVLEEAERAADATVAGLPQMAIEEQQRVRELFIQRFRQHLASLQDPSVRQQCQAVIEGEDMGKSPTLLKSPTSNMALPSSSSSSS